MSKVVDSWWYNTTGIVKVHDEIINQDKFYIGNCLGLNEDADADFIAEYGAPFYPEVVK